MYLLGHSTPDLVRRYSATHNSEKAARAYERPAPRIGWGSGAAETGSSSLKLFDEHWPASLAMSH